MVNVMAIRLLSLHRWWVDFGQQGGGAAHGFVVRVDEVYCTALYYLKLDLFNWCVSADCIL